MKLLEKESTHHTIEEGWWTGRKGTCERCRAVVEIEPGDRVFLIPSWGDERILADCPRCGGYVHIHSRTFLLVSLLLAAGVFFLFGLLFVLAG